MPCCLRTELYLQLDSMRLPDEMHYSFLCGSMATAYGADRVATLAQYHARVDSMEVRRALA